LIVVNPSFHFFPLAAPNTGSCWLFLDLGNRAVLVLGCLLLGLLIGETSEKEN
jgi:hypothetical protein